MKNRQVVILLSFLILTSFDAFSQSSWEIDKSKEGIVVYTRNEEDSDFKSFKAVATFDASTAEILSILKNADDYTKWYGFTKRSKLLEQDTNIQYNYVETIFPWPYDNRDMVYSMSVMQLSSGVIEISLLGLPDYIPEKKGIVRMQKAMGTILLKPVERKTEITYTFHTEPGDNIPSWLANSSIAELQFKTLKGLRDLLQERK